MNRTETVKAVVEIKRNPQVCEQGAGGGDDGVPLGRSRWLGMALRWGQMCRPHGLGEASAGAHAALGCYGLLFQR